MKEGINSIKCVIIIIIIIIIINAFDNAPYVDVWTANRGSRQESNSTYRSFVSSLALNVHYKIIPYILVYCNWSQVIRCRIHGEPECVICETSA